MSYECDYFVILPSLSRESGPAAQSWAAALRGVLVLLRAAPAEVHPAHVVPVAYPVAGVQALQVLNHRHSAGRSYRVQEEENRAVISRASLVLFVKENIMGKSQTTCKVHLLKSTKELSRVKLLDQDL